MSFLWLDALAKTYPGGTQAVKRVDLSIAAGEFVVLLGPSGCGKTTTLRMIAGLETPSAGRVELAGRDVTRLAPAQRDVGFVFQFYALYPHMSVAENIAFPLLCSRMARAEREQAVAKVAQRLGLSGLLGRRPRELSGGDQQRVGLARAMVRRPAAWLMDEPLGTLDSDQRGEMCEFLRAQQLEARVATVYVTHDQEEAMRLADRVVVMSKGEILQAAPPSEVYDEPATLFVARFVGSPGMNLIEGDAEGHFFRPRACDERIELPLAVPDGPCVLGARPEFLRREARGPLRARIVLDAFHGACRYLHADAACGRLVARAGAEQGSAAGEEARFSIEPAGLRLFDPASGRRIA